MLNKGQITAIKAQLNIGGIGFPLAFQALGDPGRFKIFKLLMNNHEICVTDVSNILDITVSAASQQLRTLERVGLALKIRMGQMVCYEINKNNPVAKKICKLLSAL